MVANEIVTVLSYSTKVKSVIKILVQNTLELSVNSKLLNFYCFSLCLDIISYMGPNFNSSPLDGIPTKNISLEIPVVFNGTSYTSLVVSLR